MSNETLMLTEDTLKKLHRDLLITRIITVISSVLMLCILAGGFIVFHTVQGYVDTVQEYVEEVESYAVKLEPAVEVIAGLEAQDVEAALEQMTLAFGEVDWKTLSEGISQVDWEALSKGIGQVDWKTLSDSISEVDWKGLSESFEKVDWEALANKVEELDVDAINSAIGGLDTEEFSTALENMNSAARTIRDLADKLTFWD